MHAYIVKPDGSHYTSLVFGYDLYEYSGRKLQKRYYLVLNEEKTALVRHLLFPKHMGLKLQAVATDLDRVGWYTPTPTYGCVPFLRDIDLSARTLDVPQALVQKCIELEAAYVHPDYRELITDEDGASLRLIAGNFHDACVEQVERIDDAVHVRFSNCWGYILDMWFEGSADFRNPGSTERAEYFPDWFSSTLTRENGLWYLIDEGGMTVKDITDENHWFCGRHVRYRIMPK